MGSNIKKRILKKSKLGIGAFETRQEDKIHYENAYNAALKATHIKHYDVKALLKTLTTEELKDLIDNMPGKSDAKLIDNKVKHVAKYLKEMQALSIVEDKILHAKEQLCQNFAECFTVQYTRPNGKNNFQKFLNDAEYQLEKLQENNNQMDDSI